MEDGIQEKARQQEKHYHLLKQLQTMSSELPLEFQQRLPYELLSDLSHSLMDETVGLIVKGLKDLQQITEKTIFEKRQKLLESIRTQRADRIKTLKEEITKGTRSQSSMDVVVKEMDDKSREELHRFDMKAVMDLDQVVSEQQVTLEKTGVSGFYVTNKPTEIRLQMFILDFITRIFEASEVK